MSCVYKHTFPNGAVYIGKTNMEPEQRWANGWGYRNCPSMFNAIIQYGWDNIKHEILFDNISDEKALEIETQEIEKYCNSSELIYNIHKIPPEHFAIENKHFIDPNRKTICTPTRVKEPICTYTHDIEPICTHKRRSKDYVIPLTPKPDNTHSCPIDVYTTTGDFICTYPSALIASQELKLNHGDIISCCRGTKPDGHRKFTVGKKYICRYHVD